MSVRFLRQRMSRIAAIIIAVAADSIRITDVGDTRTTATGDVRITA